MPRVHYVKAAAKDNPAVKKGQPYYWWSTRTTIGKSYVGRKHYSATPPRQSQLTSSEFLQNVYSLQEEIEDADPDNLEELESLRDGWVERINEIRDECQEKLDNMPEGLQQGATGELLQERIDALESWAADLEGVDIPSPAEPDGDEDDGETTGEEENETNLQTALDECRATDPGL